MPTADQLRSDRFQHSEPWSGSIIGETV